jgi:hypothetical protein
VPAYLESLLHGCRQSQDARQGGQYVVRLKTSELGLCTTVRQRQRGPLAVYRKLCYASRSDRRRICRQRPACMEPRGSKACSSIHLVRRFRGRTAGAPSRSLFTAASSAVGAICTRARAAPMQWPPGAFCPRSGRPFASVELVHAHALPPRGKCTTPAQMRILSAARRRNLHFFAHCCCRLRSHAPCAPRHHFICSNSSSFCLRISASCAASRACAASSDSRSCKIVAFFLSSTP